MEPLGRRRYGSAEDGIKYLERLLRHNTNPQFVQMVRDGDSVHREFGRLFHPDNLHRLKATEFKEFLLYEHNRHWWGIHRHQAKLVADMDRLRVVLGLLLDESSPIEERLNRIEPISGPKPLPGLGKAVFTPILHVVYPSTYGVWNSVAESAMKRLKIWPLLERSGSFGEHYVAMNASIGDAADKLGVDLWTIDSLWWLTELEHEPQKHQFSGRDGASAGVSASSRRAKAIHTFQCSSCFLTKPNSLRSKEPAICMDCNPEN